jgi:hypothetical protein
MTEVSSTVERASKHVPWNKGKIVGGSRHCVPSTSGVSGQSSRWKAGFVT